MSTTPHYDKYRPTTTAKWITRCRLMAGKRQSDLAKVYGSIDPALGNQGRASEFETGKRAPSDDVVDGLYQYFSQELGAACPPPPSP